MPRAHRRWDDDDLTLVLQAPESFTAKMDVGESPPGAPLPPLDGGEWAAYADADARGPQPPPSWVVIDDAATDHDRGILKTGKEADVHLVERIAPDGRHCLLAAKHYRSREHRMFHRDASYLEGRRVRRSREMRAMATRTEFGLSLIGGQWAWAEHAALGRLWSIGLPVPYPVQLDGMRLLLEFIGDADGVAAPRLAQVRATRDELARLWVDLRDSLTALADAGYTHGDLSAYNLLVHEGRVWLIDLPQIVDIAANPRGPAFVARDVANVCGWFTSHGVPLDADAITEELLDVALRRRR